MEGIVKGVVGVTYAMGTVLMGGKGFLSEDRLGRWRRVCTPVWESGRASCRERV